MERHKGGLSGLLGKLFGEDTELQAGVSPGQLGRERAKEIAHKLVNGWDSDRELSRDLQQLGKGQTDDWYGRADGDTVSFQREVELERRNTNAIDNRVDDETRYPSDSGYINGEPVCKYRKRNRHG